MGPLTFLSRVKFSRATVSDLFYLLKIDDLTFLKVLFFVKCWGAAFQNVGFAKKYLKKIYYLPITAVEGIIFDR